MRHKRRISADLNAARTASLAAMLMLLSASPVTLADAPSKDTSAWWGHIKVLASDQFQGRLTGSSGYQQAAAYVADRCKQFGLAPAGENGYFQPVGYVVQTVMPDRSTVSLVREKETERLSVGDDLNSPARVRLR